MNERRRERRHTKGVPSEPTACDDRGVRLLRYGLPVGTIFGLLGRDEDDMTYALGFVASRSHAFARRLLLKVAPDGFDTALDGTVRLQTIGNDHEQGRTDIEIEVASGQTVVFEAKRGATLPSAAQLAKYVPRLKSKPAAWLVAVTNTPEQHAAIALPPQVGGIPVKHLTWRDVRVLARLARAGEANRNKHLLDEFVDYLGEILGMETARSNMVYVVSLGSGAAWGLSFKDVVEQRRYFYPVEGRWPAPPNYIAFRHDGRLQAIHHVDGVETFTNPHDIFPHAEDVVVPAHYCLRLGPAIKPGKPVKNGPKIVMNMRVWCMIDTLLSCDTITDALAATKKRLGADASDVEPSEG